MVLAGVAGDDPTSGAVADDHDSAVLRVAGRRRARAVAVRRAAVVTGLHVAHHVVQHRAVGLGGEQVATAGLAVPAALRVPEPVIREHDIAGAGERPGDRPGRGEVPVLGRGRDPVDEHDRGRQRTHAAISKALPVEQASPAGGVGHREADRCDGRLVVEQHSWRARWARDRKRESPGRARPAHQRQHRRCDQTSDAPDATRTEEPTPASIGSAASRRRHGTDINGGIGRFLPVCGGPWWVADSWPGSTRSSHVDNPPPMSRYVRVAHPIAKAIYAGRRTPPAAPGAGKSGAPGPNVDRDCETTPQPGSGTPGQIRPPPANAVSLQGLSSCAPVITSAARGAFARREALIWRNRPGRRRLYAFCTPGMGARRRGPWRQRGAGPPVKRENAPPATDLAT